MAYGLGVDVGVTFTAAAVAGSMGAEMVVLGQHEVLTPSVVVASEDGVLLTGEAAEARAGRDPSRVAREFKRRMGDPTPLLLGGLAYAPTALLAALVHDVVDTTTAAQGGRPDRVVLTHPASWGPYRREQLTEVALLSGLDPATTVTVTEPQAAATYYATVDPPAEDALVAASDLGGGTFDATVLRAGRDGFEILGTPEGLDHTGVADLDEIVVQHVHDTLGPALATLDPADPAAAAALARLRRDCTLAKETLSAQPEVTIAVPLPDGPVTVTLTRADFNHRIQPTIDATLDALHRALHSAGIEPADLSEVQLTGGASRIPLVTERLTADLDRPIRTSRHPKHAVALGAAILAYRDAGTPGTTRPATSRPGTARPGSTQHPAKVPLASRRKPHAAPGRPARRALLPATAIGLLVVAAIWSFAGGRGAPWSGPPAAIRTPAGAPTGSVTTAAPTRSTIPTTPVPGTSTTAPAPARTWSDPTRSAPSTPAIARRAASAPPPAVPNSGVGPVVAPIPPPPSQVSAYSTIQAESYTTDHGVLQQGTSDSGGGLNIGWLAHGDWARYNRIDFGGTPARQFVARAASGAGYGVSGLVEVRLDSPTAPVLGSFAIANTGGWQCWRTVPANISAVTGVHDVYVTFTSAQPADFVNLNWLTFGP